MIILDTDSLSLLMTGKPLLTKRVAEAEAVAITVVSRIEILQGRFASLLTAATGEQLLRAQHWLSQNEQYIRGLEIVPFAPASADAFDRLVANRRLRRIGRADLLIASITLAQGATLVTRNLRHFRQVPGLQVENWAD